MSYLVLARKYRPQSLEELIGQEHITEILKKTISTNRVGHAYLFCGPRGVGKTSCARILAKSLNCQNAPTLKPCGQCSPCQEIAQGRSLDVLEIDGASNRGIDEIRALRENVKFAPSQGHFKIYIVDEVHMLTMEAFNALLKTLEEPPEHVKFIFATTVPNKVPATIISRCHRFDFKRIPLDLIAAALRAIAQKEKFKVQEDALYAIAKASEGGLRDALSIMDQLGSLSDKTIETQNVYSMLGLVENELLFELADALAKKECALALDIFEKIIEQGKDIQQLVRDLLEHFRHLMIIKIGGKNLGRLVQVPIHVKEKFLDRCGLWSLEAILKVIDQLIEVQETARVTESMRIPFEIALARLTYQPGAFQVKESSSTIANAAAIKQKFSPVEVLKSEKGQIDLTHHQKDMPQEVPLKVESPSNFDLNHIKSSWDTITHAISKEKMSVATYLQEGKPVAWKEGVLVIGFPSGCVFQKENLERQANLRLVERIFSEKLNGKVAIQYRFMEGSLQSSSEQDPVLKNALDTFKGKVVNRWYNE